MITWVFNLFGIFVLIILFLPVEFWNSLTYISLFVFFRSWLWVVFLSAISCPLLDCYTFALSSTTNYCCPIIYINIYVSFECMVSQTSQVLWQGSQNQVNGPKQTQHEGEVKNFINEKQLWTEVLQTWITRSKHELWTEMSDGAVNYTVGAKGSLGERVVA